MFSQSVILWGAIVTSASAQYAHNNTIGSCADVHCPPDDTPVGAVCHVQDKIYNAIGLTSFASPITEPQDNLTWTVGFSHQAKDLNGDGETRWNESVEGKGFYLGSPPSLELKSNELPYKGCAIFLYGNRVFQNGSDTCEEQVGTDCIAAVQLQAETILASVQSANDTTKDSCQQIQMQMNQTFPSVCSNVTHSTSWNGISAIPLTGEDAPSPPAASQNESTDCHPTLPKSNDLAFVFGYNETSPNVPKPIYSAAEIILTAFWSPDKAVEGALSSPDLHLTCLWPNDLTDRSLGTIVDSAAGRKTVAGISLFLALGLLAVAV